MRLHKRCCWTDEDVTILAEVPNLSCPEILTVGAVLKCHPTLRSLYVWIVVDGVTGPSGKDEVILQFVSQHGKTWPYWFRKMGQYPSADSMHLLAIIFLIMVKIV